MERLIVPAKIESISEALDFIENALTKEKVSRKEINEAMLLSEESMVQLIENAPDGNVHIKIKPAFGCKKIKISAPGKEFEPNSMDMGLDFDEAESDREAESAIRGLLMQTFKKKMKYVNHDDCNFMEIVVGIPERAVTWLTGGVFIAAILLGIVLKLLLPKEALQTIDQYLLYPVEALFLNALKLCVAPMVFLSIITSMPRFFSFSGSGRIGIKVIVSCFLTSAVAVFIGYLTFRIFSPGTAGELSGLVEQINNQSVLNLSSMDYVNTIVNIVPTNIIEPFSNMDTLQLIFLALLCGIALSKAGGFSKSLRTSAEALETLCSNIVELIQKAIPFVTFFATLSMIFNVETHTLLSLFELCGTLLVALIAMLCFYSVAILLVAHVNPFHFFKKYLPLVRQTFFAGSASAMMTRTISFCKSKLGVDNRVCSFSIPFGAMANMDGTCIYVTMATLFMAKLCGIDLFQSGIVTLVLSVVVLCLGAPITSGTAILVMSMLFTQTGVSMSAISLFLGLNALIEMVLAMSDTIGDVTVSILIAKSENMLNKEVYNA